jgi:Porin subfamily
VGGDDARARSIANLQTTAVTVGTDPTSSAHGTSHPDPWVSLRVSQAWGRASIAVLGHKNAATYYTSTVQLCTQTGSSMCGHPDDKWGFAVVGGIEVKLDWLSPGSRIGGYGTYGVGATRITRNSQTSPDIFGSGNQLAFGVLTDAVYVNGSDLQLTTSWAVGGGFEYFWTRNFSSTIYGGYTGTRYNDTVTNNRWFCGTPPANSNPFGSAIGNISTIRTATGAPCNMNYNFWQVGTHHDWFPVPGLRFAVDVIYTAVDTAFDGQVVTLGKALGARPTGVYTVKDLGILAVAVRAQRSWGAGD